MTQPLTPRGDTQAAWGLSIPVSPPRAFLAAALSQDLCQVLLVVTKEVEEKGCWLQTQ